MVKSDIEAARYFRVEGQNPKLLWLQQRYPIKYYQRDDHWKLDFNKEIIGSTHLAVLNETFYKRDSQKIFHRLNPGLFINDLVLDRFSALFNQWEAEKVFSDPEYKPAIMVSGYFISELSGHKLGHPSIPYKTFRRFGLSGSSSKKKVFAGADIFTSVSTIYFLRNIGNWHWGTFAIDTETLLQRYYDSLHRTLDKDKSEGYAISKLLHEWLLDYHHATMGVPHPKKKRWTRSIVTDSATLLRNARQTISGNDCGLHAAIVPVLLQAGIPLNVLGHNPELVSRELRLRMTLTLATNTNYFQTDSHALARLTASARHSEDVLPKINQIKELRKSIVKK